MVFRVSNQAGQSIILKQALPYARCVGESWPLTLDRARIEAEALLAHSKVSPGHTAKVIAYNPELALMLLEDLGHMQILRTAQKSRTALSPTWPAYGTLLRQYRFLSQ